ncbi:MAG: site-specific integrase [Desulfobacterales bacterium]
MRVKKCSCGHTKAKFKVRVKTPEGKWLTKQVPTLSLAKKVELKFQSQSVLEGIGIYKAPVLDDIWKRYLKYAKLQKKTWDADESRWLHHIKPKLSSYQNLKMDKVTPGMIQDILDAMFKTHKPATRKQVLQLINRVYNWSIKQKFYHGTNPCQSVSIPKFDNRVTENLAPDDIERLIGVLVEDKNKRASLVVLFALYTGKRRGEILRLTWQDIDWGSGIVTFKDTKNKKTHSVPVNKHAMEILKTAQEMKVSDLVFPCDTGKYYHSFSRTWYRIRDKAGVNVRFHGLRHVYASHLASSGKVDLFVLKELLGHKDIKMTQRYSHIMNSALRKGTEVADELFR